jgi:hypothetical protein
VKYKGWSDPALQERIAIMVDKRLWTGMTCKEVEAYFDPHTEADHGHISGALSLLHGANKIACLTDRRDGRYIYVALDFIDSRPCRAQGRDSLTKAERDFYRVMSDHLEYWLELDTAGSLTGKTTSTRADKYRGMFVNATKEIWRGRPEP